jgi:hypothetical protein
VCDRFLVPWDSRDPFDLVLVTIINHFNGIFESLRALSQFCYVIYTQNKLSYLPNGTCPYVQIHCPWTKASFLRIFWACSNFWSEISPSGSSTNPLRSPDPGYFSVREIEPTPIPFPTFHRFLGAAKRGGELVSFSESRNYIYLRRKLGQERKGNSYRLWGAFLGGVSFGISDSGLHSWYLLYLSRLLLGDMGWNAGSCLTTYIPLSWQCETILPHLLPCPTIQSSIPLSFLQAYSRPIR